MTGTYTLELQNTSAQVVGYGFELVPVPPPAGPTPIAVGDTVAGQIAGRAGRTAFTLTIAEAGRVQFLPSSSDGNARWWLTDAAGVRRFDRPFQFAAAYLTPGRTP